MCWLRALPRNQMVALAAAFALTGCGQNTSRTHAAAQPAPAPKKLPAPKAAPPPLVLAKNEVALEEDGGTFVVPVIINDAIRLKFTVDSGAADVTIPADVVMTLVRTGTINDSDFIGRKTFVLADGSTVPSAEFRIRSLKIGSLTLENVTGSVSNVNGTLLLGQSFLSRLASWSMDNQRHVLLINEPNAQKALPVDVATQVATIASESAPQLASATAPVSAANSARSQAIARLSEVLAAWSSPQDPSAYGVRRFYAPTVDYYGAVQTADNIIIEKLRFAARWPVRSYHERPDTVTAECPSPNVCTVQGLLDWRASSPVTGRVSTGVAQFQYSFRDGLIVAEAGKVVTRD